MLGDRLTRRGRSHGEAPIARMIRLGHAVHHGVLGRKVPGLVFGPRPSSLAVPVATVVGEESNDTCQVRV